MNNRYILLRHGNTIYQEEKKGFLYLIPERDPVFLTEKGKEQIKISAEKLAGKKIDLIYSSDLVRTRQTAGIAAEKLGLKIILDKRLRDINFGIFQGGEDEKYRNFFSSKKQKLFKRPPGGENWRDVKKRTTDFLKEIDKKYTGKIILVISHGDPIWLMNGFIKGLSEQALLEKRRVDDPYSSFEGFYAGPGEFIE
ncbi:MAG: hypothetical protein A3F95_00250 [Candidatus Nealsonbacteria bacterium RIFCSPLOWO2_12_FULL_39_31]|uniref:Phosphoglycerate mutase n=2 Tax=Candidatus Nealsoniibacteriota TaxID=1817911 RepID=A0A1G2EJ99_9BACT|nr:MAG: Phosphoglycerate mutase [Parcubacteria group bacterium GW2011_GWA2_38_27]KKQ96832.1 MAG: Phosphoglycerate mutase [Parcubacteria group bacterium GW2011_GWC2_39_11]OGZ23843.1 MAG: hypothetical protein A2981_01130 [Candidatus Nealsonbacteria bacterium RIFCSPLOWO2_01_FULL_38_120]OGZ25678.1 MAG: hypothetical protein A3I85_03090 [Candidatus Nealsonbacteria bacterium RIFCSPLOWO2_02_FULL_38_63]OGZ25829.1 MAG: hypothetical protein A3F95_00250 [Candidatus Nealsonbacteria bacterium RIFCSPLOWO2_12_